MSDPQVDDVTWSGQVMLEGAAAIGDHVEDDSAFFVCQNKLS